MPETKDEQSFIKCSDGSLLNYFTGKFDDWQVRLSRPHLGISWYPPTDTNYFKFLKDLGATYGNDIVYNDFIQVYDATTKDLEKRNSILCLIKSLSIKYDRDSVEFEIWLSVLYMAMIAEENKQWSKLGKRIKRLGVHRVLIENITPVIAANESKGQSWKLLDHECKIRGF